MVTNSTMSSAYRLNERFARQPASRSFNRSSTFFPVLVVFFARRFEPSNYSAEPNGQIYRVSRRGPSPFHRIDTPIFLRVAASTVRRNPFACHLRLFEII